MAEVRGGKMKPEEKEMTRWKEEIEDDIDELRDKISMLNERVETLGTAFSALFNIVLRTKPGEVDNALKELMKLGKSIDELEGRIEELEEKINAIIGLVAGIERMLERFRLTTR